MNAPMKSPFNLPFIPPFNPSFNPSFKFGPKPRPDAGGAPCLKINGRRRHQPCT